MTLAYMGPALAQIAEGGMLKGVIFGTMRYADSLLLSIIQIIPGLILTVCARYHEGRLCMDFRSVFVHFLICLSVSYQSRPVLRPTVAHNQSVEFRHDYLPQIMSQIISPLPPS
jgi:hypothetical protein